MRKENNTEFNSVLKGGNNTETYSKMKQPSLFFKEGKRTRNTRLLYSQMYWLVLYVSVTQARDVKEEGNSVEELSP